MDGTAPLEEMPSLVFEQPKPKIIVEYPVPSSDNSDADSALSDGDEQQNVESVSTPEVQEEEDGLNISSSSSDEVDGQSEDADFELESQQEEGNEEDDEDEGSQATSKPSRRHAKSKPDVKGYDLDPDLYGLRRSVGCPSCWTTIAVSKWILIGTCTASSETNCKLLLLYTSGTLSDDYSPHQIDDSSDMDDDSDDSDIGQRSRKKRRTPPAPSSKKSKW